MTRENEHLKAVVRALLREMGRLTPEGFRAQLEVQGVIADLKRRKLWLDDARKQRRANARGFTFGDLWGLCARGVRVEPVLKDDVADAAATLRKAASVGRRMHKAFPPPWTTDLGAEVGDEITVFRVPTVVGDFEAMLDEYASELQDAADRLRPHRRETRSERLFVERWAALAQQRCGTFLDDVGAKLFAITFGTHSTTGFRKRRERAGIKRTIRTEK